MSVSGGIGVGSYVKLDTAKLAALLSGSDGPVYRHWIRMGEYVKEKAQGYVGVKSGTLRDSLVKRMEVRGTNLAIVVGTDVPYALYHHEGTVPHTITGNPWLAFEINGTLIVVHSVKHPGTKPNRFLTRALDDVRALL